MFKWVRGAYRFPSIKKRFCHCKPEELADPNTKTVILQNGLRVATEETSSALACVSLFVEVGPRFETACNNGISHFIEHMAFKGFKTMNKKQLEICLLNMGVKISVETTKELQIFTAYCPAEYARHVVDIYSRIICDLELDINYMEDEKNIIYEEMDDADNDPKMVTFDYLHQTAFQGTPLAQPVIGPTKNLSSIDKDLVCRFMFEHYQPYKICLAICGGVCHENMVLEAERHFGKMNSNPNIISDQSLCRFTGSQVTYRDDSMPFTHVTIAFEVPGYRHEDYLPLLIMSCMTGTWCKTQCGYHGPPLAIAAAHDNCHYYDSFYLHYKDVGLWGIYYVAEKMQVEDMLYNIQKQWMSMCMMTTTGDLQRAINVSKLKLGQNVVGAVRSSHDIGYQMMYTCGRRSVTNFYHLISNVNVETIRNTAYKYLYDKCPAVAAVGPTECVPDYTRIRAGQYSLKL